MKRCPWLRPAAFGVAFLAAANASVFTAEGATGIPFDANCTIKIDGKFRIHERRCEVAFFANLAGPQTCGSVGEVYACVECDIDTKMCTGWFREGKKPGSSLGRLKRRKKDCWSNKRTLICFENMKECPGAGCSDLTARRSR